MNASLLAVLNDTERLLVAETGRAELAALDEDAAIELETRIRRVQEQIRRPVPPGRQRRRARARRARHGPAREQNKRAAMKAEALRGGPVPGEPAGRGPGPAGSSGAAGGTAGGSQGGEAGPRPPCQGSGARRGPARPRGHRRAHRRPGPALARQPEAAGEHARHGCPPASEAGQPLSTSRASAVLVRMLARAGGGRPVSAQPAPGPAAASTCWNDSSAKASRPRRASGERSPAQPTVTDGRSPAVVHRRFQGRGTRQRGMRFRRTTRSRRDRPVLPAWLRGSPPTDGA